MPKYPKGVIVKPIKLNYDNRGFSGELFRIDWKDIIKDEIKQVYYSFSYPGVVRAWHRHLRGQVDYMVVLWGNIEVLIRDNTGKTHKILTSWRKPKLIRIPGHYWHGYRNVGMSFSVVVYLLSQLYNYQNPDEERREYNG